MFRPAALSWWRIRTEKGTSLATAQRDRPLFGLRCQTASICHPGNRLRTWYRPARRLAKPPIALVALARRSSRSSYGLQKSRREKLERLRLENLVMLAGKTHDI